MLSSNEGKIIIFGGINNEIYSQKYSLNEPKIIKSEQDDIIFKILDKDKDNNFKLIITDFFWKSN